MGVKSFLEDYVRGVNMSNNSDYARSVYQQRAVDDERNYKEQQAKAYGLQANYMYGSQAQQAQPGQYAGPVGPTKYGGMDLNVGTEMQAQPQPQIAPVEAQDATGAFVGASPEQIRQLGFAKRAMATGQVPGTELQQSLASQFQKSSLANEQSRYNTTANNQNALQRQQLVNQQSGVNNRSNNQGQMARTLATNPYNQFTNNKDKYTEFMKSQQQIKDSGNIAKDMIKGENDLQKVYFKESDDFNSIDDAYARVRVAQDTGIGDTSLIFSIMKLMDPRSTVREGEAATAKNSAGLPAYLSNLYNEVVEGRALSPEARQNILAQADDFYSVSKDKYAKTLDKLQGVADRRGYNRENVFTRSFMKDDKGETKPITKPGTKVIKEMTSDMKAELKALRSKYNK